MTVTSLSDVQTRLATNEPDTFRLSRAGVSIAEVSDVLASLGLEALVIEQAKVTSSTTELTIAGKTSLFFIDGMAATATFVAGDELSVTVALAFPDDVRLDVPFIEVGIGRLSVTATVQGPSLDVPVASIVLGGEITFGGHAVPITITPGAHGWTLRAERIALPTLADVASLLRYTKDEVKAAMPPGVADLGGLSIAEFVCVVDTDRWAVSSISVTVEAGSTAEGDREWRLPAAPFVVLKKPITLRIGIDFPQSSDDGEGAAHPDAKPVLTGSLTAEMKIGETLTLPVRIARDGAAWRVGVLSATGFPTVGELITLIGNESGIDSKTVIGALPSALTTLGIASSSLEVTIPDGGDVSVFFDARLKERWTIVEGMVEVHDARLQVDAACGGEVSGFFSGTVALGEHGEVEVPIAVQRSAESATWTLRLACTSRQLPGVSALPAVPGGTPLPSSLPALELSEFTVVFGEVGEARKTEVQSIVLKAGLTQRWAPPGLDDVGLREAALEVNIDKPGDDKARKVTAALATTLDVANVDVPVLVKFS